MDFTFSSYTKLIDDIQQSGYQIVNYHNFSLHNNPCILRHDVDFDLIKANRFAKFENEIGVKSTYFVLLNTDFYNVFSSSNKKLLLEMKNLGHEIALHYDEMQYDFGGDVKKNIDAIQSEASILSDIVCAEVNVVSMHRPSKYILESNLVIPNMINSYSQQFFKNFKYFSDSRMHWREDVKNGINIEKNPSLHILTHPIWYEESDSDISERLKVFINENKKRCYCLLNDNFTDLESVLSIEEI